MLEEEPDHAAYRGVQPWYHEGFGDTVVEVEESARAVPCLDQAVGVEQQPVARLQRDILPGRARMQAERRHRVLQGNDLQPGAVGAYLDGRMVTAIDNADLSRCELGEYGR